MAALACRKIDLNYINDREYQRRSVSCLVLSQDKKIILQLRDAAAPTFPNCLATFGGGIEPGETPMQALVRELHEELGAIVSPPDVMTLGAVSEPETHYSYLIYVYFWHDRHGSITGCYEGHAKYFNDAASPKAHPKVMTEVIWVLDECAQRGLLK